MADTTTSYADWLNQNPDAANAMANGFQQPAPVSADPYAKFDEPAIAAAPAPVAAPTAAPTSMVDSQPVKAAQAVQQEPVRKPADTGDKGHDGILNIAKTIASFYTGGAAGGIQSMATSGQSGGSNGAAAQGSDNSQWLSMLGSFGGGG